MKRAAVVYLIFVLFPFALTLHAQAQAPAHGGEVKTESPSTSISVTVMLSLHALDDAEALMKSLTTPGDPQFHKFLTADQFVARFAPKDAEVAKVVAELSKYGLAAQRTTATTLNVTGQPFDMERAFSVSLHTYEVPAHGNVPGYTYHVPLSPPTIPAEISEMVSAVVGLDSGPSLHTNHHVAHNRLARASAAQGSTSGNWTVLDFANYYDVQLLYKLGLSGKGRTLGIVTLASFTPSDAFAYWSALGLSVDPNRIQIVNIDGGPRSAQRRVRFDRDNPRRRTVRRNCSRSKYHRVPGAEY
jgi:subtilase family serine protease